jgi:hypothetical protein
MKTLALICLLLLAPGLHAREVNKCVDKNGGLMLTDEPCHTLKPKPAPAAPVRPAPPEKTTVDPQAPILPPPEQQIRPAPMPAPAEKPPQ